MMTEIDGFTIEPNSGSHFSYQRTAKPQHTYNIEINSKRVTLVEILPADVAHGDPLADAKRVESSALKVTRKHQRRVFG